MEFPSEVNSNVNFNLNGDSGARMDDGHEAHLIFAENKSPYLDNNEVQYNVSSAGAQFSPSHSFSHVEACMDLQMEPCVDDCENYLHVKPEMMFETVKNAAIMSEIFDSQDYLNLHNEEEEDSELGSRKICSELSFDDISNCLSDITSEQMSSLLSFPDSPSLEEKAEDGKLSLSSCLEDPEEECLREEALLLAEVEKAEKIGLKGGKDEGGAKAERGREAAKGGDKSEQGRVKGGGSASAHKKKAAKVDWTPELHRRFVQAVEQLGLDKAIPSKVLELMGVKCLTRHNVSSHLQKYRSHRKQQTVVKEVETDNNNQSWRWGEAIGSNVARIQPPMLARPTTLLPDLHVWGHPCWPSSPACILDAWGRPFIYSPQPVLRIPLAPLPTHSNKITPEKHQQQPLKGNVIAAINEVLQNPYVPLPIGLKPPPLESVISELQHQGVSITS